MVSNQPSTDAALFPPSFPYRKLHQLHPLQQKNIELEYRLGLQLESAGTKDEKIKELSIVALARLYGGGASQPITIIGGTSTSRRGRRSL